MPLINESHDSLPYIDSTLTTADLASAQALIAAELPSIPNALHPSLPATYQPTYTPLLEQEHARLATDPSSKLQGGIDLSRYEAIEPPTNTSPTSDEDRPELLAQWRAALQRAYAAAGHLNIRLTNLALLETYGKNAWLIGNAALEDILKDLERELAAAKREGEDVEGMRRAQQAAVAAELGVLEREWRDGVRRMLQVEMAAEGLRREVLERKRAQAQAQAA